MVHFDRELCEGALAAQPRASGDDWAREAGLVTKLTELSGRSKSNLSRTLKTMSRYGLVELQEGERGTLVPRVPYDQVRLDVSLTQPPRRVA